MASDSKSRLLGFWREQLVTDGGRLQVALEVFSTIAVAVAAGTVLPAFLVGSYSIVLLSLAGCLIGVFTFAAAYKRHFVGLVAVRLIAMENSCTKTDLARRLLLFLFWLDC
mmetsp:Transcript_86781/g.120404  ORF Transcript_86781/g.120404 Transcript_86781/m.120404 type:complete len:111 (-) Transcript_86781:581-913(-)